METEIVLGRLYPSLTLRAAAMGNKQGIALKY